MGILIGLVGVVVLAIVIAVLASAVGTTAGVVYYGGKAVHEVRKERKSPLPAYARNDPLFFVQDELHPIRARSAQEIRDGVRIGRDQLAYK